MFTGTDIRANLGVFHAVCGCRGTGIEENFPANGAGGFPTNDFGKYFFRGHGKMGFVVNLAPGVIVQLENANFITRFRSGAHRAHGGFVLHARFIAKMRVAMDNHRVECFFGKLAYTDEFTVDSGEIVPVF